MITAHHILLAVLAVAGYAVVCLVKPQRRCGRCKGKRRSARYVVAGSRVKCRRCRGNGRHPRRGATAVHWLLWSGVVEPLRERRRGGAAESSPVVPQRGRGGRQDAAVYRRAQQRADRLIAYQARLRARTGTRAWQFA